MFIETNQLGISYFELASIQYWVHWHEISGLIHVVLLISEEERIQAFPQWSVRHTKPPTGRCEQYVLQDARAAVKLSDKLIHEVGVFASC